MLYSFSGKRGGIMSKKDEAALKNVSINEVIKYLKKQSIDLKNILKKIDKMQEFHEINDMTNQVFERRLIVIEDDLKQMKEKVK